MRTAASVRCPFPRHSGNASPDACFRSVTSPNAIFPMQRGVLIYSFSTLMLWFQIRQVLETLRKVIESYGSVP